MSDDGEHEIDFEEADAVARLKWRRANPYASVEEAERAKLFPKATVEAERARSCPEDEGSSISTDSYDGGDEHGDHGVVKPFTKDEYMQLEAAESDERKAMLEEFERRKRARKIHVSTDDAEVCRVVAHGPLRA